MLCNTPAVVGDSVALAVGALVVGHLAAAIARIIGPTGIEPHVFDSASSEPASCAPTLLVTSLPHCFTNVGVTAAHSKLHEVGIALAQPLAPAGREDTN